MAMNNNNPNKDFEVPNSPQDTVSSLSWSPKANFLVAGSWDARCLLWEVMQSGESVPKMDQNFDGPVLSTCWSGDGSRVFAGCCDRTAQMWILDSNTKQQVAAHNAPIKNMNWLEEVQLLATGSWDKTIKYWDLRSGQPAQSVNLPERCYSMDATYPLLVCATADRHIVMYDLRNPGQEYKRLQSPLKYQSRVISCFPDQTGFALGSIEGRVAVHHVEDRDNMKNFAFKCHREGNQIFAVNSISFHPQFHTFATAGSDGCYNFWDKDSKQRLKPFLRCNNTISAAAFNNTGQIYAYAVGYDWSKGAEFHNPQAGTQIMLHAVQEGEIKPRDARAAKKR